MRARTGVRRENTARVAEVVWCGATTDPDGSWSGGSAVSIAFTRRTRRALVVLIAGAVVAASCGSSHGSTQGGKYEGASKDKGSTKDGGTARSLDAGFDPDRPPVFIVANVVNPDKVYLLSKFRSGIGHDFSSGSGETCRSMKHYLSVMDADAPDYKIEGGGGKEAMPLPDPAVDVPIYSPADGTYHVGSYDPVAFNSEVDIVPASQPVMLIRLMHVTPLAGLADGATVRAGEQVGLVLRNQPFDVAISAQVDDPENKTRYVSMFAAMDDATFAAWQRRGAESRDDLILSRGSVDAAPWQCEPVQPVKKEGDANFAVDYMAPEWFDLNLVKLDGHDEVSQKIKAKYGK